MSKHDHIIIKPIPSKEQIKIINKLKNGHNVVCDAVAGSGKTTTVLSLGEICHDKKILQITYNKHLKLEVRNKIKQLKLENIEVHTYHSLAVKYYNTSAFDDNVIRKIIDKNKKSIIKIPYYDIIIIDEAQDMNMLYYRLITKFVNDSKNNDIIFLIIGDNYQGIYEFKGADTRFLTLAPTIWNIPMKKLTLKISYRVTKPIAKFINKMMLGENRITSIKKGYPVTYIRSSIRDPETYILLTDMILKYINVYKYTPEDIFILAPSLKSAPCKSIERFLVSNDISCYAPLSDESSINNESSKGKIVFSTFHQSKGRERKIVIICNFDGSYFEYYDRESRNDKCTSLLYVAATRAFDKLILLEDNKKGPLDFIGKQYKNLKNNNSFKFIDLEKYNKFKYRKILTSQRIEHDEHRTSPTELVKFLDEKCCDLITSVIDNMFKIENPPNKNSKSIPQTVKTLNGKCEEVSDLNGLVIPSMFSMKYSEENYLWKYVNETKLDSKYIITECKKIVFPSSKISDNLFLGNVYLAISRGYHHKLAQIDKYNWLTEQMIDQCHENLKKNVSNDTIYEFEINCTHFESEYGKIKIYGRLDAVDNKNNTVWEFKCVDVLQTEHLLQLIVYAWMWSKQYSEQKKFKILNIRTGELRTLTANAYMINEIVELLFMNKYIKKNRLSNNEFINECLGTTNKENIINKKEITTRQELEKYDIGCNISYMRKDGQYKKGGIIDRFKPDYFIYIDKDGIKIRVRYINLIKMWVSK